MKISIFFMCLFAIPACGAEYEIKEPTVRVVSPSYGLNGDRMSDNTVQQLDIIIESLLEQPPQVPSLKETIFSQGNDKKYWRLAYNTELNATNYEYDHIPQSPAEVYDMAYLDCKNRYISNMKQKIHIREPEKYCHCEAKAARQNSYKYKTITRKDWQSIQSLGAPECKDLFDVLYEMKIVYSLIYNLCKTETNNVAECDKLAVNVKASAERGIRKIRPDYGVPVLYESEYKKLIQNPQFILMIKSIKNASSYDD